MILHDDRLFPDPFTFQARALHRSQRRLARPSRSRLCVRLWAAGLSRTLDGPLHLHRSRERALCLPNREGYARRLRCRAHGRVYPWHPLVSVLPDNETSELTVLPVMPLGVRKSSSVQSSRVQGKSKPSSAPPRRSKSWDRIGHLGTCRGAPSQSDWLAMYGANILVKPKQTKHIIK